MQKPTPRNRSFEAIGKRLKAFRKTTGLSQKEFANRAGIADTTYNQYEQGKSQPKVENAYALCDTYGLTLDWIFSGNTAGLPYRIVMDLQDSSTSADSMGVD
jgi:transcriptional regulator with XRE-family HTH domain